MLLSICLWRNLQAHKITKSNKFKRNRVVCSDVLVEIQIVSGAESFAYKELVEGRSRNCGRDRKFHYYTSELLRKGDAISKAGSSLSAVILTFCTGSESLSASVQGRFPP